MTEVNTISKSKALMLLRFQSPDVTKTNPLMRQIRIQLLNFAPNISIETHTLQVRNGQG